MLDEDDLCERRCFFPEEFERVSERLSPQARSLWAKTGRGEQSHLWEPLYVHMGDSGEIARLLWSKWLPRHEDCSLERVVRLREDPHPFRYRPCRAGKQGAYHPRSQRGGEDHAA